jgi:N-hydroxyarylamine O-acetyltransferase
MRDLDAYLKRVGTAAIDGRAAPPERQLADLHRAHVAAIPFENLDPRRGIPISLAPDDLEDKLVHRRRGGYCFEQNLLLKAALEAQGAEVDMLLARVRVGRPPGTPGPRTHLVLRVRYGGRAWHADVGFGRGTLLEPVPFGPGGPYEQAGWRFRVVEDARELVLQTAQRDEWVDLYGFVPHPVPLIDVETSNWFTCTHPRSPFVTGLIVSTQRADGTRTTLSDWDGLSLTEETPLGASVQLVEESEVDELIVARFGLDGSGG